jgi:hypothetical protein
MQLGTLPNFAIHKAVQGLALFKKRNNNLTGSAEHEFGAQFSENNTSVVSLCCSRCN